MKVKEIYGLEPHQVLCALYNASKPVGMGILNHKSGDMEESVASTLLATGSRFDYLSGRLIKTDVDPSNGEYNFYLYDRDMGEGAALKAIEAYSIKLKALSPA